MFRSSRNSLDGAYKANVPLAGLPEICRKFKTITVACCATSAGDLILRNGSGVVEESLQLAPNTRDRLVVPITFGSFSVSFVSASPGTITECETLLHKGRIPVAHGGGGGSFDVSAVTRALGNTLTVSDSAVISGLAQVGAILEVHGQLLERIAAALDGNSSSQEAAVVCSDLELGTAQDFTPAVDVSGAERVTIYGSVSMPVTDAGIYAQVSPDGLSWFDEGTFTGGYPDLENGHFSMLIDTPLPFIRLYATKPVGLATIDLWPHK